MEMTLLGLGAGRHRIGVIDRKTLGESETGQLPPPPVGR